MVVPPSRGEVQYFPIGVVGLTLSSHFYGRSAIEPLVPFVWSAGWNVELYETDEPTRWKTARSQWLTDVEVVREGWAFPIRLPKSPIPPPGEGDSFDSNPGQ